MTSCLSSLRILLGFTGGRNNISIDFYWGERMKKVAIIVICIVVTSCAFTDITSITNPDHERKAYGRILIISPFQELRYRKMFEYKLSNTFYDAHVDSFAGIDLISPIKSYSDYELRQVLDRYQIDGILVASLTDYYESQTYVPPTQITSGSVWVVSNYVRYSQTTNAIGGGIISRPRMKFEIRLYDRSSGEVAWLSQTFSKGNAFADFVTLADSLSRVTIRAMST